MKEEDVEQIKQRKHTVSELCIDIGDGQAVITKEDLIEFHDCLPLSIPELEYVIRESKNYISFRNYRIFDNLFDEFPDIPDIPHTHAAQITDPIIQFNQLIDGFPEHNQQYHTSAGPKRFDQLVCDFPEPDDAISTDMADIALVSTWGIQCGIATYTKYLYDAIKKIDDQFPIGVHPISEGVDGVVGRVVHYQHEFGIMPKIPRCRSKVIVTFHTVPENIGSTIAAYEKNLNVVAYVAHFKAAVDIISAATKKDVWPIPHGSKIMPYTCGIDCSSNSCYCNCCAGANEPVIKEYFRKLIQIPIDEPCAFLFGFQSDNKNYTMVTQACEKVGIKLIISGAVNDHANYRGNIGCGRDNVVVGRFLSEIEVDLYALASDLLLFQTNPIKHYSCSGALHRVIGAGKPVICNRVNHYSDLIEDEDCLKYDSEEELVEKIKEALEKKEEFGRKALEYAERTSWEIVAKKHMEMYKQYGGV